jgi:hypothetical protein
MREALTFGSVTGSAVATVLFAGISVFFGFAITSFVGKYSPPVSRPSSLSTWIRRTLGVIACAVGLAAVWHWLWSGFYVLTPGPSAVTLEYLILPRQRTVPFAEIRAAYWESGPKFSRVFVLETRDGRQYRSTQTNVAAEGRRRALELMQARAPGLVEAGRDRVETPIAKPRK